MNTALDLLLAAGLIALGGVCGLALGTYLDKRDRDRKREILTRKATTPQRRAIHTEDTQ